MLSYQDRRARMKGLSDEELRQRFWELAGQLVRPLADLAESHTSPSVERSVLLRMGFSSLEARAVVEKCHEAGLLGKGAGHAVLAFARARGLGIREAGRLLAAGEGWNELVAYFGGGDRHVEPGRQT